jgi:hypothetical protein
MFVIILTISVTLYRLQGILFSIGGTWGEGKGGKCTLLYFFHLRIFLTIDFKRDKYQFGVRMGEKGVCILRTDSNQSSPSF